LARIDAFLQIGRQQGASDIHFTVGQPPLLRLDGDLMPVQYRALTAEEVREFIDEILTPDQQEHFATHGAADFSYVSETGSRYRVNTCRHQNGRSAFCRVIPDEVPDLKVLGLPSVVGQLARLRSGLVLVTGTTGTGKSTTLAALLQEINHTRSYNVITLEDPIEYVHRSEQSLIVQREVGTHVNSFKEGLRAALREDPDVILVGEMRDADTVSLALEAAETGHLVLGTLHTRGAAQTIDRIIDAHPSDNQSQVRHSLADNLRAVVSQNLLRAADGRGRRVVAEVLIVTFAIQQLIREGKTFQISAAIATGRRLGMQLMDQALLALVRAGEVDPNEAYLQADEKWGFAPFVTRPELVKLTVGDRGAA
jgi:twitching motility protein PilT